MLQLVLREKGIHVSEHYNLQPTTPAESPSIANEVRDEGDEGIHL